MRIRALSVFEGVVYHSSCLDPSSPCTPVLEVEALLRDGDADAGPLLLPYAEYAVMVGEDQAKRCLPVLRDQGRLAHHLGVLHLTFPMWTAGDIIRR